MSGFSAEVLEGLMAAVGKILAFLSGDGEGRAFRTSDPVGEAVCDAVEAAGGSAAALFAVSESLSKRTPFSARKLRSLRNACRWDRILDEAALGLFGLLAGDPAADEVEIGKRVDQVLAPCAGPATEADILAKLAAKLQTSARRLRQYRDAYLVAQLGAAELARLVPGVLPNTALVDLALILKVDGLMPWRKKDMILKAAEEIARRGLEGKAAAAVVGAVLAEGAGRADPMPVIPQWNFPPARASKDGEAAPVVKAA